VSGGRRILLVSPVFHEYWRSIAEAFEADGHTVVTHRYDAFDGLAAKVRNKVAYEGLDRVRPGRGTAGFARVATERARTVLRDVRPDVVVAVKADLLEPAFWDDLDDARIPRVLWLYDELRRTRHTVESLARFPAVASYSPLDVAALRGAGVAAHHVPLPFDPARAGTPVPSSEVVFIGARYPNRERLLLDLVERGVPVRAFGRDWSTRAVDRLRTWSWARPAVPSGVEVSRSRAGGLMAGALGALNVHGDQDGFTMRTFEAAGVGALELVDRDDVGEHYEPGVEVLPFGSADEAAELVDRARTDRAWAAGVAAAGRARTLAEHTFAHRTVTLAALWA
jgi:spore maturation protein CgeB